MDAIEETIITEKENEKRPRGHLSTERYDQVKALKELIPTSQLK